MRRRKIRGRGNQISQELRNVQTKTIGQMDIKEECPTWTKILTSSSKVRPARRARKTMLSSQKGQENRSMVVRHDEHSDLQNNKKNKNQTLSDECHIK